MSTKTTDQTSGQQNAQKALKKKKRKKIIKTVVIILIILAVVLFALTKLGLIGDNGSVKAETLTTYTVGTRSITQILTSSGTIEPNDQYTITALVSGEIIGDYFEEGDTVIEDQLLYKIDSDNLNSSVTRAENALKNANSSLNDALENLDNLNVETEFSGIVKKIHVEVGDDINSGTLIAEIVDNNTMCIDIPFMEVDAVLIKKGDSAIITFDTYEETKGTVDEISSVSYINSLGVKVRDVTIKVKNTGSITTSTKAFAQVGDAYCTSDASFYNNDEGQVFAKTSGEVTKIYYDEGDTVYDGNIIVRLESEDLEEQIDKLRDNVTEAQDSLEDANDAYDNYNIEAPITGKVISKNYKTGDTLSNGQNSSNTLAVIYDMSALKFSMSIDELDIDKLDEGQDVIITCDSREGEEYHGIITNISIQGTTSSGTTFYPVEVTIENTEDIDKRTVADDGTINKVYMTGMTSTEKVYSLVATENHNSGTVYIYSDDISILKTHDGSLYDGDKLLKEYIGGTYTQGSNFYDFSSDFSSLTLEIQNDKKMLKPGMNIDAEIIVENRENVIAVPLAAVGRGNVVKVLKTTTEDNAADENTKEFTEMNGEKPEDMPEGMPENMSMPENGELVIPDGAKGFTPEGFDGRNERTQYGTAPIDSEYEEVRVTVGISDDDYVEITSGLDIGDTVVIEMSNLATTGEEMMFGMMGGGMPGDMGGGMPGGMGGGMSGGMGGGMGGGPMGR